ncbi:hypothetical protein [Solirubrobacter soli]|uniref:hypothetical protein n=1 Tax=Solirubrobacter soli TaxID=363832 RepID=UPI000482CFA4|nr:hypothetical protein [Solirubrobacter soli]
MAGLQAATWLEPPQLQSLIRAQRPHVIVRRGAVTGTFDEQLRAAFGCLREDARHHGRLVAFGQAWGACNRLGALLTARSAGTTQLVASAVAGEVLCRLLDDIQVRRVLSRDDERLLRHAWHQAHPAPPYVRRQFSAHAGTVVANA